MRSSSPILALAALAGLAAQPAAAADPVSPQAFAEEAVGQTLHFSRDGRYFGSEAFREDGRVTWRFPDGSCVEGAWRAHGAQMCFLYEASPEVQCWRVLEDEEGYFVRLLGESEDAGMELRVTGRDTDPLLCGEPGTDL